MAPAEFSMGLGNTKSAGSLARPSTVRDSVVASPTITIARRTSRSVSHDTGLASERFSETARRGLQSVDGFDDLVVLITDGLSVRASVKPLREIAAGVRAEQ